MNKLEFEYQGPIFGRRLYAPKNAGAKEFCKFAKRKNITHEHMQYLQSLGLNIVIEIKQLELPGD